MYISQSIMKNFHSIKNEKYKKNNAPRPSLLETKLKDAVVKYLIIICREYIKYEKYAVRFFFLSFAFVSFACNNNKLANKQTKRVEFKNKKELRGKFFVCGKEAIM